MIAFVMPLILCATVLASVGFGVLAAYAVVFCVFSAFGRAPHPQPQPVPTRPRLVLVTSQNHASGD